MASFGAADTPPTSDRRGRGAQTRVPCLAETRELVVEASRARAEARQRARPFLEAAREAHLRLMEAIARARDAVVVMPMIAMWVATGEGRSCSPTERIRLANLLHQQLCRHRRGRAAGPRRAAAARDLEAAARHAGGAFAAPGTGPANGSVVSAASTLPPPPPE